MLPSAAIAPSTSSPTDAGEQLWEGWEQALLADNDCFLSWLPYSKVRRAPHTHTHTPLHSHTHTVVAVR